MITKFEYFYHTIKGITHVTVTFAEDFGVTPLQEEKFTFGRLLPDIGDTYVKIDNLSQQRQLIGFATVPFDSLDVRRPKPGMIYFTCRDWTPPPQDSSSEATDENQGQNEPEADLTPTDEESTTFLAELTRVETLIAGCTLLLVVIVIPTILICYCQIRE